MYQVLIADDDNMVRLAMKTMVDWNAHGFALCGVAENGKQALELALACQPHLVITDVDMPVMNGIRLIRALHTQLPLCRTLILSNYNDFSYVREGLREGAMDYILKVELSEETLVRALQAVKQALLSAQPSAQPVTPLSGTGSKQSFSRLVNRAVSRTEPACAKPMESAFWQGAATLYCLETTASEHEAAPKPAAIHKVCAGVLSPTGALLFEAVSRNCFCALDTQQNIAPAEAIHSIQAQLALYLGHIATITSVTDLKDTPALLAALTALLARIDTPAHEENTPAHASALLQFSLAKHKYEAAELDAHIATLFDALQHALPTLAQKKHHIQQIVLQAWPLLSDAQREAAALPTLLRQLDEAPDDASLQQLFSIFARPFAFAGGQRGEIVAACAYIRKNLSRRIALHDIAQAVGLRKNYLCTLFKQATGQSVGEYLLEQRLEEARKLLLETSFKVFEVGEMVGIPDPLYFSKVFKRKYGTPPSHLKQ